MASDPAAGMAKMAANLKSLTGKSLEQWAALVSQLDPARFQPWITGSTAEGDTLRPWLATLPAHVRDATGQSLAELLSFTQAAHVFVGASTGPLHIAAALGLHTIGLYPARETGLITRWAPLGAHTSVLMPDRAPTPEGPASLGIQAIEVSAVRGALESVARPR